MKKKFKIDFIGIGAEKSATYWVSDCLAEHPEICLPSTKELFFFNDYDPHFFRIRNIKYERGIRWYESCFANCKKGNLIGEFSPTYMYSETTAERIKKDFPEVKLIICLRNPVDRAFSQYLHYKRLGRIGDIDFEEAMRRSDSYFVKGLYCESLKYYFSIFPRNNIFVMKYEDLKKRPEKTIEDLYRFVGVEDYKFKPPSLNKKTNSAATARFPLLNYIMIHAEYFIRDRKWDGLLRFIERVGIRRFVFHVVHFVNIKPLESYPTVSVATRKKLKGEYLSDIKKLEKLLKRSFDDWKK